MELSPLNWKYIDAVDLHKESTETKTIPRYYATDSIIVDDGQIILINIQTNYQK